MVLIAGAVKSIVGANLMPPFRAILSKRKNLDCGAMYERNY